MRKVELTEEQAIALLHAWTIGEYSAGDDVGARHLAEAEAAVAAAFGWEYDELVDEWKTPVHPYSWSQSPPPRTGPPNTVAAVDAALKEESAALAADLSSLDRVARDIFGLRP